jgi:hypothetical protein
MLNRGRAGSAMSGGPGGHTPLLSLTELPHQVTPIVALSLTTDDLDIASAELIDAEVT